MTSYVLFIFKPNEQIPSNLNPTCLAILAARYAASTGEYQATAATLSFALTNIRGILSHFSPKIVDFLSSQNISTPSEEQVLTLLFLFLVIYRFSLATPAVKLDQLSLPLIGCLTHFLELCVQRYTKSLCYLGFPFEARAGFKFLHVCIQKSCPVQFSGTPKYNYVCNMYLSSWSIANRKIKLF